MPPEGGGVSFSFSFSVIFGGVSFSFSFSVIFGGVSFSFSVIFGGVSFSFLVIFVVVGGPTVGVSSLVVSVGNGFSSVIFFFTKDATCSFFLCSGFRLEM